MVLEQKDRSFWEEPVSRRNALLALLGLLGIGAGVSFLKDFAEAEVEILSQYDLSERVTDALNFLQLVDTTPKRDSLYGFTFPSTREIAGSYHRVLQSWYNNPDEQPPLIIIEEKETGTVVRRLRQFLGLEEKNLEREAAILVRKPDEKYADTIYLAPSFHTENIQERALTLYHEGVHLFNQLEAKNDLEHFENEKYANIAEILLRKAFITRGFLIRTRNPQLLEAYIKAVVNNNPKIWEKVLKEVYEIKF